MGIKFFSKISLIVILISFCFTSCNKDTSRPCLSTIYFFNATSEWTPQNLVYNIGDTITLHSVINKTLNDVVTGNIIDYSGSVQMGGDIGFAEPDSIMMQNKPAKDSFTFISIQGRFIERSNNKNQGINFEYIETDSNYIFKGKIICNKKGYYAISVDDLKSVGIRGKNCTNASFDMTVTNSFRNVQKYENIFGIVLPFKALKKIYCISVF